jgi:alkanesulfonate monooxygenase SsuD/methylene tetrahydromethanopterin reductase-like flavin-dependent oxidoreductase (luciferase family)
MSTHQKPLAVVMMPLETRHEAILHLATCAESRGYDAIFLPETWTYDTLVLLSNIAVRTRNLKLGTGILSVWGRTSATMAMASSTLQVLSEGRFILGLGSSTQQMAEGLHDVPYGDPYEKLLRTISQLRSLVQGNRIPLGGDLKARPLRLNLPEYSDVPIYLAASSSKSILIAGEMCDGWIPFLYPRDSLKDGIKLLEEGAQRRDDPVRDWTICPIIPTIVSDDHKTARKGAAWVIAFYLTTMGPIYRNVLSRYRYKSEVESVLNANIDRKPSIVPEDAEALLEQLTIYGTKDEVEAKLERWYSAGATMPSLMINPHIDLKEIDFMLSAFRS